eukprot:3278982-Rhodomonas_salina.1
MCHNVCTPVGADIPTQVPGNTGYPGTGVHVYPRVCVLFRVFMTQSRLSKRSSLEIPVLFIGTPIRRVDYYYQQPSIEYYC